MDADALAFATRCWGYRVARAATTKRFRLASLSYPIDGIYVISWTSDELSNEEVRRIDALARRCGNVPWKSSGPVCSHAEVRTHLSLLTMRKRGPKPIEALKNAHAAQPAAE